MQTIKDIIGNVLADMSGHKNHIQPDWEEAWLKLGSLAKGSKPIGFDKGCLTVMIDNPARGIILKANQAHILSTLKSTGDVQRIYYKVGKV